MSEEKKPDRSKAALDNYFGGKREEEQEETKPVEGGEEQAKPEGKGTSEEEQEEAGKKEGGEEEDVSPEEDLAGIFSQSESDEEEPIEKEGEEEPIEEEEELSEEDFERVTSSATEFNKFITNVRTKAVAEASKAFKEELATAKEELLRNIPSVVSKSTERATNIRSAAEEFYKRNPDLKEKTAYVRNMTSEVAGKNPDMDAETVLKEVEKRARRDFGAYKEANEREQDRKKKGPKFAGSGGRRAPTGSDARTKQQKLMDQTFGPRR